MSRSIVTRRAAFALALWAGALVSLQALAETEAPHRRAGLAVSAVVLSNCAISRGAIPDQARVECMRGAGGYKVERTALGETRTTDGVAIDAATRIVEVIF